MHSFGFQYAFEKRVEADLRHFYTRCFGAATSVIRTMIETLAPSSFMLYSPDGEPLSNPLYVPESDIGWFLTGHFVFTSFASAFLLKVGTGSSIRVTSCTNALLAPAPAARVRLASRTR
jgi:hypothetical protein